MAKKRQGLHGQQVSVYISQPDENNYLTSLQGGSQGLRSSLKFTGSAEGSDCPNREVER